MSFLKSFKKFLIKQALKYARENLPEFLEELVKILTKSDDKYVRKLVDMYLKKLGQGKNADDELKQELFKKFDYLSDTVIELIFFSIKLIAEYKLQNMGK